MLLPFFSAIFFTQDQVQKIVLPGHERIMVQTLLPNPDGGQPRLMITMPPTELNPPKPSPKLFGDPLAPWYFPWHTDGYVRLQPTDQSMRLRFRIFAQDRNFPNDITQPVCRQFLRLWELDAKHLSIDHADLYNGGIIDVYLCKKGEAGGEQLFTTDTEAGINRKVDTIYIYDLPSFIDGLEQAREIAHEYGHSMLPGVRGYSAPEDWANGYLGEKLYLRWLRDEMEAKRLTRDDVMNVNIAQLNQWIAKEINPLASLAGKLGPVAPLLKATNSQGMDAFHGLVLYCDSIMPSPMFARSLRLLNGNHATDFLASAPMAAEERTYIPKFPSYIHGKVWIPVGASRVTGAEVLRTKDGWSEVVAKPGIQVIAKSLD